MAARQRAGQGFPGVRYANLDRDGPLRPFEAKEIIQGGGGGFRGLDASCTCLITLDLSDSGHVVISTDVNPPFGQTRYSRKW